MELNLRGPEANVGLLEKWRNPSFGESGTFENVAMKLNYHFSKRS